MERIEEGMKGHFVPMKRKIFSYPRSGVTHVRVLPHFRKRRVPTNDCCLVWTTLKRLPSHGRGRVRERVERKGREMHLICHLRCLSHMPATGFYCLFLTDTHTLPEKVCVYLCVCMKHQWLPWLQVEHALLAESLRQKDGPERQDIPVQEPLPCPPYIHSSCLARWLLSCPWGLLLPWESAGRSVLVVGSWGSSKTLRGLTPYPTTTRLKVRSAGCAALPLLLGQRRNVCTLPLSIFCLTWFISFWFMPVRLVSLRYTRPGCRLDSKQYNDVCAFFNPLIWQWTCKVGILIETPHAIVFSFYCFAPIC